MSAFRLSIAVVSSCVWLWACGAPAPSGGGGGGAGGGSAGGGGTGTGGGGATGSDAGTRYEPLVAGGTWSYDTTDLVGGVPISGTKVVTVEGLEAVPGKTGVMAWRLRTVVTGVQLQDTWQENQTDLAVRHRDDVLNLDGGLVSTSIYAPYRVRVDESAAHIVTGTTYPETYSEVITDYTTNMTSTKMHNGSWQVVNGAEQVSVPAGNFTALHLQKLKAGTNTVSKDYWFVRGVGKVKETAGSGRVEVLHSYNIP